MTKTLSGDDSYRLLIGDEWQLGGDGTYPIINPATEEIVGEAPEGSVDQALAAAASAKSAFDSWSQTTPKERAALLQAAADALRSRVKEFVPLVISETGCTATVGRTMQVPQAATRFERYAQGALEPSVIP